VSESLYVNVTTHQSTNQSKQFYNAMCRKQIRGVRWQGQGSSVHCKQCQTVTTLTYEQKYLTNISVFADCFNTTDSMRYFYMAEETSAL